MGNNSRQLIVISPETPPQICGVGDYSYQLAQQFLIVDTYSNVQIAVEKNEDKTIQTQIPVSHWSKALAKAAKSKDKFDVLLNYTPLGFSKFGYSFSFISALKKFKKANPDNRIFVLFHEVWHGGKLAMHHKIRDEFSKLSSVEICKLATGISVVTNEQKIKVEAYTQGKTILLQPVGANIYPAASINPLETHRNDGVWVVFGLSHTRLWTLQANATLIEELVKNNIVKQIRSIGPKDDGNGAAEAEFAAKHFGDGILQQLGTLPINDISGELLKAQGAFVGQTADSLTKSGTFLSMAAHGVPVVCNVTGVLTNPPSEALFKPDELLKNPQLINIEATKRTKIMLDWYKQTRSWNAIGKSFTTWMAS